MGPIASVWQVYVGGMCGDVLIDSDWLAWSPTTCKGMVVKNSLSFSADRPDHIMLFRVHVSRKAAGKARAVLEGVGLDQPTINACFSAYPLDDEKIIQDGLTRWCGGKGTQPPTWNVLIAAMKYAEIAQQDIRGLEKELGH